MRVVVTGGRTYASKARVSAVLDEVDVKHGVTAVIHGGARGADQLCAEWAVSRGKDAILFAADWENLGKGAGFIRNAQMLKEGRPDCCIAFPGGAGTAHMLGLMRKSGLPLWVIE